MKDEELTAAQRNRRRVAEARAKATPGSTRSYRYDKKGNANFKKAMGAKIG